MESSHCMGGAYYFPRTLSPNLLYSSRSQFESILHQLQSVNIYHKIHNKLRKGIIVVYQPEKIRRRTKIKQKRPVFDAKSGKRKSFPLSLLGSNRLHNTKMRQNAFNIILWRLLISKTFASSNSE